MIYYIRKLTTHENFSYLFAAIGGTEPPAAA